MLADAKKIPTSAAVCGYLRDGYVFAAERAEREDRGFDFNIFRAELDPNRKREPEVKRFTHSDIGIAPSIYRWRIAREAFWDISNGVRVQGAGVTRIALDELSFFDPANLTGEKDYRFKHHDSAWHMEPVADVALEYQRRAYKPGLGGFLPDYDKEYVDVFFDLLPWDEDSGRLFILEGDSMRVWHGAATQMTGEPQEWQITWTELKDEKFTTEMREPFIVYAKGRDYYFITQSGKIHVSRKPKPKEQRKAEPLWTDAKSPIRAIIVDVDKDNYFAFTGPAREGEKGAKRVYFELGDKDAAKPYELKNLDARVAKPLKVIVEYTQVLLDDKKIKPAKEGGGKK
jgi:hypothetical protein